MGRPNPKRSVTASTGTGDGMTTPRRAGKSGSETLWSQVSRKTTRQAAATATATATATDCD